MQGKRELSNQDSDELGQSQRLELVGSFAGGIVHDLNNQLTIIMNHLDLALRGLDASNPVHGDLADTQRAAARCADMTSRLLAFVSHNQDCMRAVDLEPLLEETERLLRTAMPPNIEMRVLCESDLPQVLGDATQLQQVLLNLAVNARDAMQDGGRLEIRAELQGNMVGIEVRDTGCGISPQVQERIFEPFFTTKRARGGTGLGLASVAAIVKSHKGEIHVESSLGAGTTFRVSLPLGDLPTENSGQEERDAEKPEPACILIADDEEAVLDAAQAILSTHGYRVIVARDGEDAVRRFNENSEEIDMLLLDVMMPRRSGPEVLAWVREKKPGMKALFTSGYTNRSVTGHFLPKPFSSDDLARRVREVIAS